MRPSRSWADSSVRRGRRSWREPVRITRHRLRPAGAHQGDGRTRSSGNTFLHDVRPPGATAFPGLARATCLEHAALRGAFAVAVDVIVCDRHRRPRSQAGAASLGTRRHDRRSFPSLASVLRPAARSRSPGRPQAVRRTGAKRRPLTPASTAGQWRRRAGSCLPTPRPVQGLPIVGVNWSEDRRGLIGEGDLRVGGRLRLWCRGAGLTTRSGWRRGGLSVGR
jgi:hypothetical protein